MTNLRPETDFLTHDQIDGAAKWLVGVFGAGVGGWLIRNLVRGLSSGHKPSSGAPEPSLDLLTRVNDVAERWVERMAMKVQELENHVSTLQSELQSLREELARAIIIEADNDVLRRLIEDLQTENKILREENAALKASKSA
jgi:cell division protein FtsB